MLKPQFLQIPSVQTKMLSILTCFWLLCGFPLNDHTSDSFLKKDESHVVNVFTITIMNSTVRRNMHINRKANNSTTVRNANIKYKVVVNLSTVDVGLWPFGHLAVKITSGSIFAAWKSLKKLLEQCEFDEDVSETVTENRYQAIVWWIRCHSAMTSGTKRKKHFYFSMLYVATGK